MYNISNQDIENIKAASKTAICGACKTVPMKSNSYITADVYLTYFREPYAQLRIKTPGKDTIMSDPIKIENLTVDILEKSIEKAVCNEYETMKKQTLRDLRVG